MRPALSSTHTNACVVSVRTLAKSSPRTNSLLTSDVEQRRFVDLERQAFGPCGLSGELGELLTGVGARLEGFLVRPERDDERPAVFAVEQPNQAAVAGRVAHPGQQLVADD